MYTVYLYPLQKKEQTAPKRILLQPTGSYLSNNVPYDHVLERKDT
jgi:hypothetical protein